LSCVVDGSQHVVEFVDDVVEAVDCGLQLARAFLDLLALLALLEAFGNVVELLLLGLLLGFDQALELVEFGLHVVETLVDLGEVFALLFVHVSRLVGLVQRLAVSKWFYAGMLKMSPRSVCESKASRIPSRCMSSNIEALMT